MQDELKSKSTLIEELAALRHRVAELEATMAAPPAPGSAVRVDGRQVSRVIENAWEVVVLIDRLGQITYASEAAIRVLGFPHEEYLGRSIFDLIHHDDAGTVREAFQRLLATPAGTATVTVRVQHTDGPWRWLEAVATNLLDDPGVGSVVVNYRDVTESRNALEALRTSEEQLRTVMASAPIVLFALDRNGVFTVSEGKGLRALGLEPGQVVGQSVFELYKDVPEIPEMVRRAMRGESVSSTVEVEELTWDARCTPVYDDQGEITGVIGVATDVTVHRRMEEALSVERAYLDELFQSSPEAIVLVDNENRILRLNREFTELFGYTVDEALGHSVDDLLAPGSLNAEATEITKRAAGGSRVSVETVRRTKGGRLVNVSILGAPINTMDGQVAVYGIYRDISERKRAEQALLESEAKYRGLVEKATHGIYRSSWDGRFLMVNPALVRMLGYDSADELLSLHIGRDVYLNPTEREHTIEKYKSVGRIDGVEVDWKRKDGTPISVSLSGRPVHGDDGNLKYFEMIAEDVTERRMLEAQLRQVHKMEAIGRLTGGIAHDFNNLLTVISANAEIVARSLPEELAELRSDVSDLQTAAQRGSALIKKLLGFGRRAMLDLQVVDLSKLVADTATMVRRLVSEDIEIDMVVGGQVSNIKADPVAVGQILLNLVTNARDAMPDGGVLRIGVADTWISEGFSSTHPGSTPGPYVCVTVADTGVGMSSETKEHIFEPFFTNKPHGVGTGLGMAMVYGLVKQLSGYVDVSSEPAAGTVVKLYFPRYEAPAPAEEVPSAGGLTPGGNETILVVEDEDAIRRTIKRALEGRGYKVLLAADGEQALGLFLESEGEIDLVISDLIMPKMGGHQLYEVLRSQGKRVPFLFTSGYSTTEANTGEFINASVPVLHKPWTLGDLFSRVRDVLDQNGAADVSAS
ncbi:MAG: PAS domain S-box protein [Gemmatimonadota bacterium]|nr:MAG: PAS domain S-box protein [Gemmatimonadota bacterium]